MTMVKYKELTKLKKYHMFRALIIDVRSAQVKLNKGSTLELERLKDLVEKLIVFGENK